MKSIKGFLYLVFFSMLLICNTSFALPFSVTPLGPMPVVVDDVSDAFAYYTVKNTTSQTAPESFVKFLPRNVKQVIDKANSGLCGTVFNLAPNASCILKLVIGGAVDAKDPNPEHHLFVCRKGGKTCAGTPSELNVGLINLLSIHVTPSTATIHKGTTQTFLAIGTFSDGSSRILSNPIWTSSNTTVASIDTSGVATGKNAGSATITATAGTISATAALTVSPAALASITIIPASASIPKGATLQYYAAGTYTDGTVADITNTVLWTPSAANVSITNGVGGGLATGVTAGGPVTITAAFGAINATASLTVTAATLQSIFVTPSATTNTVAVGDTLQFTATGNYSDGTTSNITTTVTWHSSNGNASITSGGGGGLATGEIIGSTTIYATSGTVTSNIAPLTIASVLASIAVTPAGPLDLAVTQTQNFTAMATYSTSTGGGTSIVDVTETATWTSADPSLITIQSGPVYGGLATAIASGGPTNIAASIGSTSGAVAVTTIPYISSIAVTPNDPSTSILVGGQQQFTATATLYNSSTVDVTQTARWDTSNASIATIQSGSSGGGLATGVSAGSVTITATQDGVPSTPAVPLTVKVITLFAGLQETNPTNNVCFSNDPMDCWNSPKNCTSLATNINALASLDGFIYAAEDSGDVCRSANDITLWLCTPTDGGAPSPVLSLAAYPGASSATNNIYAGRSDGTVCISGDNGDNFTCAIPTGSGGPTPLSLAADATYLYSGNDTGTVCVYTAGAWTGSCLSIPNTLAVNALGIDSGGILFAGVTSTTAAPSNGDVCWTGNQGTSWNCNTTDFSTKGKVLSLVIDPQNDYIYAGTDLGYVCLSINQGVNFTCVLADSLPETIDALAIDTRGYVYFGTKGASGNVCVSTDNGATWPADYCHSVSSGSPVSSLAFTKP